MLDLITPEEFEQFFDARTLQRAGHYFRGGHVGDVSVESDPAGLVRVNASVVGNQRAPYFCSIVVDHSRIVRSHCSCPVGAFCKHAAAALFEAYFQHETGEVQPETAPEEGVVQDWFSRLREVGTFPRSKSSTRLIYVLDHPLHSTDPQTQVFKANQRKDATFGARQRTDQWARFSLDENAPQYVMQADVAPIIWLRSLERTFSAHPQVRGHTGYRFLEEAVQTGRLFWQQDSRALAWGEPVTGHLGWHSEGTEQVRPQLEGLAEGAIVVPTDPPVVIDRSSALIHPLDIPVSVQQLELVRQAPPMATEQLQRHLEDVEHLAEQWQAPLPPGVERPRRISAEPVPILYLAELAAKDGSVGEPLPLIKVAFAYGDVEVAWHEPQNPFRSKGEAGEVMIVERDSHLERAWLDQLPGLINANLDGAPGTLTMSRRRDWLDFLAWTLPHLADGGWRVVIDEQMDIPVVEPEQWEASLDDSGEPGWFELALGIREGNRTIDLVPVLLQALGHIRETSSTDDHGQLKLPEQLWLHDGESLICLPGQRVRPLVAMLLEYVHGREAAGDDGAMRLSRLDAARVVGESELDWGSPESLQALGHELVQFNGLETVAVPEGFNATVRDYQQQGIDWLQFLKRHQLGGILADDMGLGKTVQALGHLWIEKCANRLETPALVVCPTSVLANWRREAQRFAPGLEVVTLHGPSRHRYWQQAAEADLVLTTYPLIPRDRDHHKAHRWSVTVFDEAQNLKNPKTALARAARTINTGQVIALTGTPMENHLGELWSLFDLIQPGYLANQHQFRQHFRGPIEKDGDTHRRAALTRRIRPFVLRRTKDQVTPELPEKTQIVRHVVLNGAQRDRYETIRASMDRKVREVLASKGVGQGQIEILEALLKLRQVCCDPRLLDPNGTDVPNSAKLDYLLSMVDELLEEGHRLIIFSQFTSMLGLIEQALIARGHACVMLTGQTKDRETPVERFQNGEVEVFLASLKAGGVGLNLMAADCVIHYDPWWNPAVETQATDRAWRIGQDKPVFVYRLICEGTVEQRMLALQQRKADLAQSVYDGGDAFARALSADDIKALFEPIE